MRPILALPFVLTLLLIPRLNAASPLDRIRSDAGLYVVIDDLPAHLRELGKSPLRERLESLNLFQQWKRGEDFGKLQDTLSVLKASLGHPLPDALLNLAGDQLVIAVYPNAEKEPAGVLISSPPNHDLALRTVKLWNQLEHAKLTQDKSGYWKRSTDKSTLYYLLTKNQFALSDREALIRELAEAPELSPRESIYAAPGWARAQKSFDNRSWIRAWFRPEIWAGILELPEEEPGLEVLLGQLKRAESVTLELDTQAGLHASLHLLYKPEQEPELLTTYRTRNPATAGILDQPSQETLFFLSGRGGFIPLARLLAHGWPSPQAKETRYFRTVLRGLLQGRDPYADVIPRLGESWSMDVRRTAPGTDHPVDVLLQISTDREDRPVGVSSSEEPDASLAAALENLLSTGVQLLRDSETDSREEVRSVDLGEHSRLTSYKSVSGWEPSFLVDQKRVMIASSEGRLRDALGQESRDDVPPQNPFQTLSHRSLATAQLGILLNLETLREDLNLRPEKYLELVRYPPDKRSESLNALALSADIMQLFDGGYLLWNCRSEEWSLHLGAFLAEQGSISRVSRLPYQNSP